MSDTQVETSSVHPKRPEKTVLDCSTLQKYSPLQSLHNRLDAEIERKECLRNIK